MQQPDQKTLTEMVDILVAARGYIERCGMHLGLRGPVLIERINAALEKVGFSEEPDGDE